MAYLNTNWNMTFPFKENISRPCGTEYATNYPNAYRLNLSDQRVMGSDGIFRLRANVCGDLAPKAKGGMGVGKL